MNEWFGWLNKWMGRRMVTVGILLANFGLLSSTITHLCPADSSTARLRNISKEFTDDWIKWRLDRAHAGKHTIKQFESRRGAD